MVLLEMAMKKKGNRSFDLAVQSELFRFIGESPSNSKASPSNAIRQTGCDDIPGYASPNKKATESTLASRLHEDFDGHPGRHPFASECAG
jgi:hypothetical protein